MFLFYWNIFLFLTFPLNYSLFVSCVLFFWCFTIFSLFQLVLTRMCVCSSFFDLTWNLAYSDCVWVFFVLSKCTTFPGLKIARLFLFYFFLFVPSYWTSRTHTHTKVLLFFAQPDTLALFKLLFFWRLFYFPFCLIYPFSSFVFALIFAHFGSPLGGCVMFLPASALFVRGERMVSRSHSLAYVLVCN